MFRKQNDFFQRYLNQLIYGYILIIYIMKLEFLEIDRKLWSLIRL